MTRTQFGVKAMVAFFWFGTTMCALTIVLLAFRGTWLDALWRINPDAQLAFSRMGAGAFALMGVVGAACAGSAVGLSRQKEWGRGPAIGVLTINLIGDVAGAAIRSDPRTLIGIPIGGGMIIFLMRLRKTKSEVPSA